MSDRLKRACAVADMKQNPQNDELALDSSLSITQCDICLRPYVAHQLRSVTTSGWFFHPKPSLCNDNSNGHRAKALRRPKCHLEDCKLVLTCHIATPDDLRFFVESPVDEDVLRNGPASAAVSTAEYRAQIARNLCSCKGSQIKLFTIGRLSQVVALRR